MYRQPRVGFNLVAGEHINTPKHDIVSRIEMATGDPEPFPLPIGYMPSTQLGRFKAQGCRYPLFVFINLLELLLQTGETAPWVHSPGSGRGKHFGRSSGQS